MPEALDKATRESTAATVGALVGGAVHGPEGAIAGAMLPPYLLVALDGFGARWTDRRRQSAARVLARAADEIGISVEELLNVAESHPHKELLTGQAIAAGAATTLEAKIEALGQLLARVLETEDDAVLDEASSILAALTDMEGPHARVLALFAHDSAPGLADSDEPDRFLESRFEAVTLGDLRASFPKYGVALHGVLSVLQRSGCIADVPVDLPKAFNAIGNDQRLQALSGMRGSGMSRFTSTPPGVQAASVRRWRITPLGLAVFACISRTRTDGDSGEELDA